MRKLVPVFVALVVSLVAARAAHAQIIDEEFATGSAIACVPLSSNTLPVPWVQTHGKVMHNATSTENIVLFCPVSLSNIAIPSGTSAGAVMWPTVFTVKYVDPDATGTVTNVLAELKYADAGGNMIELAVASSSAQQNGGTGISTMDAKIASTKPDVWINGQVYVQLTLERTRTGVYPEVYGYSLH